MHQRWLPILCLFFSIHVWGVSSSLLAHAGPALLVTGIQPGTTVDQIAAPGPFAIVECGGTDDSTSLTAAVTAANGGTVIITNKQTCVGRDITIPNLRIEMGGLLKPVTSHTITLANFDAGPYQVFTNALAGQGAILFSGGNSLVPVNPLWWATN